MRLMLLQLGVFLLLVGCAAAQRRPVAELPPLALSPASLGATVALQQRLEVRHAGRSQHAQALLEIDAESLRLVLLAGPKRLLTLHWDGIELTHERDPALPEALSAQRFLVDIQLAYWPTAAIRSVLPANWSLLEDGATRTLSHQDQTVLQIESDASVRWLGRILITRPTSGHRLQIDSVSAR